MSRGLMTELWKQVQALGTEDKKNKPLAVAREVDDGSSQWKGLEKTNPVLQKETKHLFTVNICFGCAFGHRVITNP